MIQLDVLQQLQEILELGILNASGIRVIYVLK